MAFVATNSITQGEQVAQLWPLLFDRYGQEIAFAHRTFSWGSEARGRAHVHVVIVGLAHRDHEPAEKRLFSYPDIKGSPGRKPPRRADGLPVRREGRGEPASRGAAGGAAD